MVLFRRLVLSLSVMVASVQGAAALPVGFGHDTRFAGASDEVGGTAPEAASPQIDLPPCCTDRRKPEKQKVEPPRWKFGLADAEVAVPRNTARPANEMAIAIEEAETITETPPCCTKRREPEEQTVEPPRSKFNEEAAEIAVLRKRPAPKDEIVVTGYANPDTSDYGGPPCCSDDREPERRKVEPPRLKFDHATAEVTVPITIVLMTVIIFAFGARRRRAILRDIRPLARQPLVMLTRPPIDLPSPEVAEVLRVEELV